MIWRWLDDGFGRLLRRIENHGLSRKERWELERRWRKEKKRSVPSPSAGFRYLSLFHDPGQEKLRQGGKAFIPAPNRHLQGFPKINGEMIRFVQSRRPQRTATLDMDATVVGTAKADSLHCYKGFKSYQPPRHSRDTNMICLDIAVWEKTSVSLKSSLPWVVM